MHGDDSDAAATFIPRTTEWRFGETFVVHGNESEMNAVIMESLMGGCSVLRIIADGPVDWDALLDGVQLEMVHMIAEVRDKEHIGEALDKANLYGDISLRSPSWSLPKVVPIRSDLSVVDGLCEALLLRMNSMNLVDFVIEIGTDYFVEIARLRALRLLLKNLHTAVPTELTQEEWIEVHFSNAMTDDIDQNMIRAGSMTLSAILGGADRIFTTVTPEGQIPDAFQRRIARNIHHLLKYESHIDQFPDPVSGAYYIEKLTRQIVSKTWKRLIEEIKKGGR